VTVPSRNATNRVLEQEPSPPDVAQISATCDVDTVPLPSPDVLPPLSEPPEPLSALVPPALVSPPEPSPDVGAAAVETEIDGFTDADEFAVLLSMPASEAAAPVPLALAPVPAPSLLAAAEPLANALVAALRSVVSTEPSDDASICAVAEAEPSPTELAETSTLADEDAEAAPSVPVLAAEPAASADAAPLIVPPPRVETLIAASAEDDDDAEVASALVVVLASADAVP
jgi:hypothetical protein